MIGSAMIYYSMNKYCAIKYNICQPTQHDIYHCLTFYIYILYTYFFYLHIYEFLSSNFYERENYLFTK